MKKWTIAEWCIQNYDNAEWEWMRTGWDVGMKDSHFIEINEIRILNPDEIIIAPTIQ